MSVNVAKLLAEAERELGIAHRDGVPWWKAPLPRRWHRCSDWTVSLEHGVARCACGGLRFLDDDEHVWLRRNERRR